MATPPLPTWYTPEEQTLAPAAAADPNATPLPPWYVPENADDPETVTVEGQAPDNVLADAAKNVGTGIARIPGAVLGVPQMVAHTADWFLAQLANGTGITKGETGADLDKYSPAASWLPSSQNIDNGIFKALSAVKQGVVGGAPVTPYEPTSFFGKLAQAGITGLGAGLLDPGALVSGAKTIAQMGPAVAESVIPRMLKTGIAASAANATQQAFPDSPGLAAAAALAAHTTAGLGASGASTVYDGLVKPLVSPKTAGPETAGRFITNAGPAPTALVNPSDADLAANKQAVSDITLPLGSGQSDYAAGDNIRTDLTGRQASLTAAQKAAGNAAYGNFRAQPPLEGAKLAPFMQSPAFRAAVKSASDGVLNRLQSPLTDFFDFNPAGDPMIRPRAAVPPDVLDRIKGKLDIAVNKASGTDQADLTSLRTQYLGLLDKEYPTTYPQTRADFAAASRPLDPLNTGPVAKVLNSDSAYGQPPNYTMPTEQVANKFLTSNATTSDYNNLIEAYGGAAGPTTALKALRENLINKVQGALSPDGTLSQDAFDKAVKPYTPALNMWFPALAKQFADAKTAQTNMNIGLSQRALTDDVAQGSLRNSDGLVTRTSALQWINKNKAAITKTQGSGGLMGLQSFANALPDSVGGGAEAAIEAAPMAVGAAMGGMEGGVLGGITHKIPAWLASPRMAKYRSAYNEAVEDTFTDSTAAAALSRSAAQYRGISGQQALRNALRDKVQQAVIATPGATIAGSGATQ